MVHDCVVGSDQGLRDPSGQFRRADMTQVACSSAGFAGEEAIATSRNHTDPSEDRCVSSERRCFRRRAREGHPGDSACHPHEQALRTRRTHVYASFAIVAKHPAAHQGLDESAFVTSPARALPQRTTSPYVAAVSRRPLMRGGRALPPLGRLRELALCRLGIARVVALQ